MANKRITDLTLRADCDDTVNFPGDDASQTWRVTAAQIKTYVKAAIAPISTLGDLLYGAASGVPTRLPGNTAATRKFLRQKGNGSVSAVPSWEAMSPPTVQKFLSGSGTYTTPADCLYIRVRMVGGGGGGVASFQTGTPTAGGNGGNTTFGSSLLVANGGSGAPAGSQAGGDGGTASLGTGPIGIALTGGWGNVANNISSTGAGAPGGSSALGGSGKGGGAGGAGFDGKANTGSGGGGGGSGPTAWAGGGGGAGGFVDAIITSPASTYAYAVGAGGTAGAVAGGTVYAGGAGAAGLIEVTEYYQ